jgi:predicted dehydrogenase
VLFSETTRGNASHMCPRHFLPYGRVGRETSSGATSATPPEAGEPLGKLQGWWSESVRHFVDCLERDVDASPSVHDGHAATQVLVAIDEAVSTGEAVHVATGSGH